MDYEALEHIYTSVLVYNYKIQYHGEDKYTITAYYYNGNKCWKAEYQSGKPHGLSLGWYENGNKNWEEEWKNGKRHGIWRGWYAKGSKWWEAEYQNGKQIK